MWKLISLHMGLVAVASLLSGANPAWSDQKSAPEGYVDRDGLWPPLPKIYVCWNAIQGFDSEKGWVKDSINKLIEDQSSVKFDRWDECADHRIGIYVTIADEQPRSDVGRQWKRDPKDRKIMVQDEVGHHIQLPTRMWLNFTFAKAYQFAQADREHHIRAIAAHEFLHALGFLHEQLRSDASSECRAKYADLADFKGFQPDTAMTEYDEDSHMNYCANIYRKPIKLSEGDLEILRKFYTP